MDLKKIDKHDKILKNKVRLVVKGYLQQECVDYTYNYASIVRLETSTFYSHLLHFTSMDQKLTKRL